MPDTTGCRPGQRAQQRALPGPVGALEEHDLAPVDVEIDAGERREATQERDRGAEVDGGLHGDATRVLGAGTRPRRRSELPIGRGRSPRRRRGQGRLGPGGPTHYRSGVTIRTRHRRGGSAHDPRRRPRPAAGRVPAVGHGHPHHPRPRTTCASSSRQTRRPRPPGVDHHHGRSLGSTDATSSTLPVTVRRTTRSRCPSRATRSAPSTSPGSARTSCMVEGVDLKYLSEGPGHFPGTPLPGQAGQRGGGRPPHDLQGARSTASTSCTPATRSSSPRCRATSPTR